eukprot:CCRYP_008033-RA/>CCRYP_008033-RA protein AED:0.42 eAED:0.42 QI:139/1/0.66/1/0/0/3/0/230
MVTQGRIPVWNDSSQNNENELDTNTHRQQSERTSSHITSPQIGLADRICINLFDFLRQHLLRQPNISTVNDIFSYIGTVSDHNSSEPYNDAYSHKQGSPKSSGGDQTMKEIANNIVTAVTKSSEINIKQPQPMGSSLQLQSSSTPTHSSLEISNSSRKHKTVKNRKVTAACNSELADESPLCGVQNKGTSIYLNIVKPKLDADEISGSQDSEYNKDYLMEDFDLPFSPKL